MTLRTDLTALLAAAGIIDVNVDEAVVDDLDHAHVRSSAYRRVIAVATASQHRNGDDGRVPTPAELAGVTDWMQRLLADRSTSLPVLAVLAEHGSTRKIRNVATNRAGDHRPGTD